MSKPKAPPAPDYAAAAQQTAAGNMENLQFQTNANRPDVYTPFGNQTWSSDPTGQFWSQNTTLDPEVEASLRAQNNVQLNQSQLAQLLQGQVNDKMAGGFQAPNVNDYLGNAPGISTNFNGFNPNGPGVNTGYSGFNGPNANFQQLSGFNGPNANFQQLSGFSGGPQARTDFAGFDASGQPNVNLNGPQLTSGQEATQAAYDASTSLLKPQMEQDTKNMDASLRLQGLTPGTEAYNNAAQNLSRTQGQQLNQIASQSVLTGNEVANRNFQSNLAGAEFGNQAQAQKFGQSMDAYRTGQDAIANSNSATGQNYQQLFNTFQSGQDAATANNANSQQGWQNLLAQFQTGQDAANANNTNSQQSWQNMLSQYATGQDAISRANEAQGQQYGQQLGAYQTGQDALANSNAAAQAEWARRQQDYQTRYQAAFQDYMQPLNASNALLTGQQVSNPTFSNVPGSTAGYVGGADLLGAANMKGQYDSAAAAAQASMFGSMMGGVGSLGSAAIGLSDERAKENIEKVGKTDAGHNLYKYNYKGQPGQTRIGVIAQEVAKKQPEAVVNTGWTSLPSNNGKAYGDSGMLKKYGPKKKGLLAVDYAQIH